MEYDHTIKKVLNNGTIEHSFRNSLVICCNYWFGANGPGVDQDQLRRRRLLALAEPSEKNFYTATATRGKCIKEYCLY